MGRSLLDVDDVLLLVPYAVHYPEERVELFHTEALGELFNHRRRAALQTFGENVLDERLEKFWIHGDSRSFRKKSSLLHTIPKAALRGKRSAAVGTLLALPQPMRELLLLVLLLVLFHEETFSFRFQSSRTGRSPKAT